MTLREEIWKYLVSVRIVIVVIVCLVGGGFGFIAGVGVYSKNVIGLIGAVTGFLSGLLVALFWNKWMMSDKWLGEKMKLARIILIILKGGFLGALAGIVSTVILHLMLGLIVSIFFQESPISGELSLNILGICMFASVFFGMPAGFATGCLGGLILSVATNSYWNNVKMDDQNSINANPQTGD